MNRYPLVPGRRASAPPAVTYSLFGNPPAPAGLAADPEAFTMGVQFSVSSPEYLKATKFYSAPGAAVLPTAIALYTTIGQVLVASQPAAWSGAPGSGWVRSPWITPPPLTPGVSYQGCIFKPDTVSNFYAATAAWWSTGPGGAGITDGPLSAPGNATSANGQDSFTNSTTMAYPASTFGAANYWVDVEVGPAAPAFPSAATTGPAAAGFSVLTPQAAADIPATAPYPSWAVVQGDGSLLVQGCSFTAPISIYAQVPVTFRGCQVTTAENTGAALFFRVGCPAGTVDACQISAPDSTAGNALEYCVQSAVPLTVTRSNLFFFAEAIACGASGVTITGNYIHDSVATSGSHNEAVYLAGDQSNINISRNTMLVPIDQTGCITLFQDTAGPYNAVTIEDNLLGGGGYVMYLGYLGAAPVTNMTVKNNAISTLYYPQGGIFGTHADYPVWGTGGNTWTGNYWYDGPAAGQLIAG